MAGGRLALRGQVGSLSSVPWEALLYRYHRKKVHARHLVKPNSPNVRQSVFDEGFFHHHRANQGIHVGVIMRRPSWRGSEVDRVVSKVNGLHFENRLLLLSRPIVSGELAERPLASSLIRRAKPFYGKFAIGGNGKPGHFPTNHRHRISEHGAEVSVFRDSIRNSDATDDKVNRMVTKGDRYRRRLVSIAIFFEVDRAMVSGRDLHGHALLILHHDPVTTEVHPPRIGILGHNDTACADVITSVMLVPFGRGKLQEIDIIAETLVLKDRPVRHLTRRKIRRRVFVLGHFSFEASHQLLARIDAAVSQSKS